MSKAFIDSLISLLTMVYGYEVGSSAFYISVGITLFAFFLVGRLLVAVFGGDSGIIATIVALSIPLLFAALAYVVSDVYLVAAVDAEWATSYLAWSVSGALGLVAVIWLMRRILDLNRSLCVLIYIISLSGAVAAYFAGQAVIDFMEDAGEQVDQREEQIPQALSDT